MIVDGYIAGADIVMLVVLLAIWRLMVAAMVEAASFALVMCQ